MAIVLVGVGADVAGVVRDRVEGAKVVEDPDLSELEELVQTGALSALVVGQIEEPVRLVQRIHAADRAVPAIILAPASAFEEVRKRLWFTPLEGEDVRVVEVEQVESVAEELTDALAAAQARRTYSETVKTTHASLQERTPRPQPGVFLGELLHHAPIGVVVVDRAGVILGWNRAATGMLELAEAAALGARLAELLENGEAIAGLVDAAFEGGEPRPEIHGHRGRALEMTVRAVYTSERERAVILLLSDVTQRVLAERKSQEAIEQLSLLARASQVLASALSTKAALEELTGLLVRDLADFAVVYVAAPDGSLGRAAAAVSARLGGHPAQLLQAPPIPPGPGPAEVLETWRVKVWRELADELEAAGADAGYVERVRRLGVHAAVAVPLVARGRSFGVLGVSTTEVGRRYSDADVSLLEQIARRAAVSLDNARLYEEARVAEARLRTLINSVDAILWEAKGPSRRFTLITERAEEILGYPASRWMKEDDFWASIIHPDDREAAVAAACRAVERDMDHTLEYRVIAAHGRQVWLRDKVYVEADPERESRILRGIMVDVTEEKKAQFGLEQSHQRFAYIARTLQGSLLPPTLPDIPGLTIEARYRAVGTDVDVGGDFYDAFSISEDSWGVSIGDVCGKGVKAAVLTALARHTIRANSLRLYCPEEVLRALNDAILREDSGDRFCTAAYVRLTRADGGFRADVAVGGHPLPLVVRADGTLEYLGSPSLLLGALPEPDIAAASSVLRPGDALLLYTDGVLDAGAPKDALGEEGLFEVCTRFARRGAKGIADEIESAIAERTRVGTARDDVALLVAQVE